MHAHAYPVTSATPGQEVRIRLQEEAARNPRAFRTEGQFSREGDVLVARTPFMFIIPDLPFVATLTPAAAGEELQLALETDGAITRLRGTSLYLARERRGGPVRGRVNGSAGAVARTLIRSNHETLP